MTTATASIPLHVPPELVFDFDFWVLPDEFDDPFDLWASLEKRGAPEIFYTPANGGHWVFRRFSDIYDIYRDWESFGTYPMGVPARGGGAKKLIPAEIDPPMHQTYRRVLVPLFAPAAMQTRGERIRHLAATLIEELRPSGHCDFSAAFALKLPTTIFLEICGLPLAMLGDFLVWQHDYFHGKTPEIRERGANRIAEYLTTFIEQRSKEPPDGSLIGLMLAAALKDEETWSKQVIVDASITLLGAGLDTVASTLCLIWRYLAEQPRARRYIRENLDKINGIAEELLRRMAPAMLSRRVRTDMVFRGVTLKKGDVILLSSNLANRDATVFEDAEAVKFERQLKPNLTFGAGPHRCIGAHLAKTEIIIALEEWLRRIPDFAIEPGATIRGVAGEVMGVENLPLVWK